jgi:hypothetical protein
MYVSRKLGKQQGKMEVPKNEFRILATVKNLENYLFTKISRTLGKKYWKHYIGTKRKNVGNN